MDALAQERMSDRLRTGFVGGRQGTLVAGLAGVLGFVITIIGGTIAGEFDIPEPTASPATVAEYYRTLDFDQMYWGISVEMLGYLLLVVFSVKLAHVLGAAERGSGWGGLLVLAGAVMIWAVGFASYAPLLVGGYRATHGGLSDEGYLLLNDMQAAFYPIWLFMAGLFILPAGIIMLRTALFPHWLGWAGVALGPALFLVGVLAPTSLRLADLVAGLWAVWILAAAIVMLARLDTFSDA